MSCKVSSGYLLCNDRSEAQTEVGRGPHEIRMFGRIVGAQSALQDIQWMSALQRPQWNEDTIRDITFDTQTIVELMTIRRLYEPANGDAYVRK